MSSRQELLEAQKRADEEAEKRKRALAAQWEESFNAELDASIEKLEALAKEVDMPFRLFVEQRVLSRKKAAAKSATKPPESPKYVNPYKPGESWSGKGPAPKWFTRACAEYERESLRDGKTPVFLPVPTVTVNGVAH